VFLVLCERGSILYMEGPYSYYIHTRHLMSIAAGCVSKLLMQNVHEMFVFSVRKNIKMVSRARTSGRNVLVGKTTPREEKNKPAALVRHKAA